MNDINYTLTPSRTNNCFYELSIIEYRKNLKKHVTRLVAIIHEDDVDTTLKNTIEQAGDIDVYFKVCV